MSENIPSFFGGGGKLDVGHVFFSHGGVNDVRSEEHTSELQSPLIISYAVFCLSIPSFFGGGGKLDVRHVLLPHGGEKEGKKEKTQNS